jgi:hypothetical protein
MDPFNTKIRLNTFANSKTSYESEARNPNVNSRPFSMSILDRSQPKLTFITDFYRTMNIYTYNAKRQITIKLEDLKAKLRSRPSSTGVNIGFNTRQRLLKISEITKIQDSLQRAINNKNNVKFLF